MSNYINIQYEISGDGYRPYNINNCKEDNVYNDIVEMIYKTRDIKIKIVKNHLNPYTILISFDYYSDNLDNCVDDSKCYIKKLYDLHKSVCSDNYLMTVLIELNDNNIERATSDYSRLCEEVTNDFEVEKSRKWYDKYGEIIKIYRR